MDEKRAFGKIRAAAAPGPSPDQRTIHEMVDSLEKLKADKEGADGEKVADRSILLNPRRREIFIYLCLRPCSSFNSIRAALGMQAPTALWHLRKMLEAGHIVHLECAGRMYYYPRGLILPDDCAILHHLNSATAKAQEGSALKILKLVKASPGIGRQELARQASMSAARAARAAKGLEAAGLLKPVSDGKHVRYLPTGALRARHAAHTKNEKAFQRGLLRILRADGLMPQVIRTERGKVFIRLLPGKNSEVVAFCTNPFEALIEDISAAAPGRD